MWCQALRVYQGRCRTRSPTPDSLLRSYTPPWEAPIPSRPSYWSGAVTTWHKYRHSLCRLLLIYLQLFFYLSCFCFVIDVRECVFSPRCNSLWMASWSICCTTRHSTGWWDPSPPRSQRKPSNTWWRSRAAKAFRTCTARLLHPAMADNRRWTVFLNVIYLKMADTIHHFVHDRACVAFLYILWHTKLSCFLQSTMKLLKGWDLDIMEAPATSRYDD